MGVVFLLLLYFFAGFGGKVFSKLCSNIVVGNRSCTYYLWFIVASICACIFFFIQGKFNLSLNTTTFVFALVYALLVVISGVFGSLTLKYANIASAGLIPMPATLILTCIVGAILFDEGADLRVFVKIVVLLIAVFFVFMDSHVKEKRERAASDALMGKSESGNLLKAIPLIAVTVVNGVAVTIVTKLFSVNENVTDETSFFFFTNAILIVVMAVAFAIEAIRRPDEAKRAMKVFKLRGVGITAVNTFFANLGSLVSMWLVATMSVSIYTPITSAMSIIVSVVASLCLKEKLGPYMYIAACVACVAVVI